MSRLLSLAFFLSLAVAPAFAQSLVGTWQDPRVGITATFSGDGSYTAQGAQGSTYGAYQVQGNLLVLQEHTGAVWQYQVTGFDGRQLAMMDAQGNQYLFALTSGGASAAAGTSAGGGALAQSGGTTLTEGDVDGITRLMHFIIGQSTTSREQQAIRDEAIREFRQDPQGYRSDMDMMHETMGQILGLSDPIEIGAMRQALVGAFHRVAQTDNRNPEFMRILRRYVQVLADDPANNLTLTSRDADGMVNYTALLMEMNGQAFSASAQREYRAHLVRSFASMPLAERQQLCTMGIVWDLVERNLDQFSRQQQAAFQQQMQQQMAYQMQANYGAQSIPDWSAQLGGGADPSTYAALSEMSQSMHLSMMNGINAMGGSDDYWEMVPADSYGNPVW